MARYTGSVCRQCRREGTKLFLKGDRCYSDKCAITKRHTPPGMHGQGRRKQSEYGIQLREKQKVRRAYGVLESQFRKYYEVASNMRGVTGDNMLMLLECRLDNVVFRLGLASTRREARQMVVHNHFTLNGKKVNVPSLPVKVGDVIGVTEKTRGSDKMKAIRETRGAVPVPKWLDMDKDKLEGKVVALPTKEDLDFEVDELLIVEYYSK